MGLSSLFRGSGEPPHSAATAEPGDPVQQARARARRRLIGAVVLLVIGVIGFPIVFETQPRPIPVDIPIEIPKKDQVAPLVMPAARPAAPSGKAGGEPSMARVPPGEDMPTESAGDAGREIPFSRATRPAEGPPDTVAAAKQAPRAAVSAASEPARKSPVEAASGASPAFDAQRRAAATPRPASAPADAARARALLEGASPAAGEGGRFVVQVGAFAEAEAARVARAKIERLGLKTYTQVAQTASGSRIRVRLGPFASRSEADAALAKARAAGLSAVVLTL